MYYDINQTKDNFEFLEKFQRLARTWDSKKLQAELERLAATADGSALHGLLSSYCIALDHYHRGYYHEAATHLEKSQEILKTLDHRGSLVKYLTAEILDLQGIVHIETDQYRMGYESLVAAKEYREKEFPGDIVGHIRSLIHFGHYKGIIARFVEQKKKYEQAMLALQEVDQYKYWDLKGEIYTLLGNAEANLANFDEALRLYQQAKSHYLNFLPANHLIFSIFENNIGYIYRKKRQFALSYGLHREALRILENQLGPKTFSYTYKCRIEYNLAIALEKLSEYKNALYFYGEVLTFRLRTFGKNHRHIASAYAGIGRCHAEKGDLQAATRYLLKALALRQQIFGSNSQHRHLGTSYYQLAEIHFKRGDYEMALSYINNSLGVSNHLFKGSGKASLAVDLNLKAACHLYLKQYEEARKCLEDQEEVVKPISARERQVLSQGYHIRGLIYQQEGRKNKARQAFLEALKLISIPADHEEFTSLRARIFTDLAKLYLQWRRHKKAIESLTAASLFLRETPFEPGRFDSESKEQISEQLIYLSILQTRALCYFGKYQKTKDKNKRKRFLEKAYRSFIQAGQEFDKLLPCMDTEEVQLALIDQEKIIFETAIQALYLAYKNTGEARYVKKALVFAEQRKALLFLQSGLLQEASPAIDKLCQNDSKQLIEQMIRELKPSTALLNYFCTKDGVYTFLIQKEEGMHMVWTTYRKSGIENLQETITHLSACVNRTLFSIGENSVTGSALHSSIDIPANKLYRLLLHPLAARLGPDTRRLVIMPDCELFSIPFQLLFHNGQTDYPIRAINTHFSIRAMLLSTVRRRCTTKQLKDQVLTVAPGIFQDAKTLSWQNQLYRLYQNRIKPHVQPIELFGSQASMQLVSQHLDKAKFIVFFSHFADHQEDPAIILSGKERLKASKIHELGCRADLVLLFGCSSGTGPILAGREGLNSIARAFLMNGAGYIIATLSDVTDEIASEMLLQLILNMARGMDAAKALAKAQEKLLNQRKYPAPIINSFVAYGSWSATSQNQLKLSR